MPKKFALLVVAVALSAMAAIGAKPTTAQTCIQQDCPAKTHLFCCPTYSFCCPDNAFCACLQ